MTAGLRSMRCHPNHTMKRTLLLIFALGAFASLHAENWPMWRGANGDGTCAESKLPEKWSQTENVAWKVELPERGNSTPVVWGDKVLVTQAIEKEGKWPPHCRRPAPAKSCVAC